MDKQMRVENRVEVDETDKAIPETLVDLDPEYLKEVAGGPDGSAVGHF